LTAAVFNNKGTTTFVDDLVLPTTASFGGKASFADTKKLTTNGSSTAITLAPEASLAAGTTSILTNTSAAAVTFTSSSAAVPLTFSTAGGGKITQGPLGGGHTFTVGNGGTLTLDGAYEVVSTDGNGGVLELGSASNLRLSTGSSLVLTGAATNGAILKGTGKVTTSNIEIIGDTNGWQVLGAGTVAIGPDTISASASTAKLTGITSGSQAITVLAGKTLIIADATEINLAATGSIVLTQAEGRLNLNGTAAKISGLTGGSGSQTLAADDIANAVYNTPPAPVSTGSTSGAVGAFILGGGANSYITQSGSVGNAVINKDTLIGND
jgi:hypothetical protein